MTDHRGEIENLLYLYAERIDAGDFPGVADLFAHAEILPPGAEVGAKGREAVLEMYESTTRLYEDGTPRTKHLVTNPIILVGEDERQATARSYFTVLQSTPELPLQPIITGRYEDKFERVDSAWRFKQRRMLPQYFGDLSQHLLIKVDDLPDLS